MIEALDPSPGHAVLEVGAGSGYWLEQLAGDGPLVVPLAHGGVHPVVAVRRSGATLTGRAVLWADFMPASGRLGTGRDPLLTRLPPGTSASRDADVGPTLDWQAYADLWFFLAARNPRVTRLAAAPAGVDPALGACAVPNRRERKCRTWSHYPDPDDADSDAAGSGTVACQTVAPICEALRSGTPMIRTGPQGGAGARRA
jgi:hypothetical protein